MKFFTPEWYNDTIVSEMYTQLRKTQKAAKFSEQFYQRLLKIEQKAFLRYNKRIARFSRQKFDAEAQLRQFAANYEDNLAFIKANLPEDILLDVKDIRVLALGSVEYDIGARIERFCGKTDRKCKAVESAYEDELQSVAEVTGWGPINSLDLIINSPIEAINVDNDTAVITTSKELVGVSYAVRLTGAQALSLPQNTSGAFIVKTELTLDGDRLSLGLLCLDQDSNVLTVEFKTKEIVISKV